ncbi:MAG: MbnP family protein [Saprospiraceae bacterium]
MAFISSLTACTVDHPNGSLTLHFKGFYDGQPLSMFTTKPFTTPEQLQFSQVSFFVSDIVLLDQSAEVDVKDLELVNLSFDDPTSAIEGFTLPLGNRPAKNYTGIRFGIGVPPGLNVKKPSDFNSSNPLSNSVNYWSGWNSFIFMKIEGRIDTIGNGSFDTGFAYHTGTDPLYRTFEANLPVSIEDGKNTNIDIDIDFKKVLEGIDIKKLPLNSNPKDSIQIGQIVQNLVNALTLVP